LANVRDVLSVVETVDETVDSLVLWMDDEMVVTMVLVKAVK